jgi:hypothetical protein
MTAITTEKYSAKTKAAFACCTLPFDFVAENDSFPSMFITMMSFGIAPYGQQKYLHSPGRGTPPLSFPSYAKSERMGTILSEKLNYLNNKLMRKQGEPYRKVRVSARLTAPGPLPTEKADSQPIGSSCAGRSTSLVSSWRESPSKASFSSVGIVMTSSTQFTWLTVPASSKIATRIFCLK